MIFEDALAQMRLGKKITHKSLGDDVYLQACRIGFRFLEIPEDEWPIYVVKMKGECEHEDMGSRNIDDDLIPGTLIFKDKVLDKIFEKPCKHGKLPQLELFLIMSDAWEFYG
jgi:hypothetical protein